jgi:hypothetical protein
MTPQVASERRSYQEFGAVLAAVKGDPRDATFLGESGRDGMFSDICLTRLVWLIMIEDSKRKGNPVCSPSVLL